MADMINLNDFSKMGVRVPASLRRKIRRLALDLESEDVKFDGKDMTMEVIFAVAALELLGMDEEEQVEAFRRRVPELEGLFHAEAGEGASLPREGEGGFVLPAGGILKNVEPEPTPRAKPKRSPKRGKGA